jgi:CHAT domain-containing protein
LYSLPAEEVKRRQSTIDDLRKRANDLSKAVSAQSELFANEYDNAGITWRQVKSALKPGEASIEIVRLRLNLRNDSIVYAALVLRPESANPQLVVMKEGRKMEGREYNYYRNLVRFQIENLRSYEIYWKPLEALLKNTTVLYFSPDGIFNKLSLPTLYEPAARQYLLDKFTITLVSNTRELTKKNVARTSENTATLLGHPDFRLGAKIDYEAVRYGKRSADDPFSQLAYRLADLPATRPEVEQIGGILSGRNWRTRVLLESESSEANVKSQVSPRLLHIATHGYFIEPSNEEASSGNASGHPMLQSGLLLAGAQKYLYQRSMNEVGASGQQDGVLTALEAMNLNLDRTDLVVLSACETASGQVKNGEGVYGLQRSFLVSGASSILMSLWKVDDESTEKLMTAFYRNWLQLGDKAQALRRTQIEIRTQYPDPYYWGAFVLMGK